MKAYEWTLSVDKVKKAEENLGRKKGDVQGQREEVERGGRELEGMEGEIQDIRARREKVSLQVEVALSLAGWGRVSKENRWDRLGVRE